MRAVWIALAILAALVLQTTAAHALTVYGNVPVDLVLVEGYKRAPHSKIEAHRVETGRPLMVAENSTIRAVASNGAPEGLSVPVLHLDDTIAIADFILREVELLSATGPENPQ